MMQVTKEEYIETIYAILKIGKRASTGQIAERMGIRPPSVTQMLAKLQDEGLVNYEPYLGARLTPMGQKLARGLIERHRVIADFLVILGIDYEIAEKDACVIEHHMSKASAARLKKFVEFIRSSPRDPKWMEKFREYCETGERDCD
ncbi:MAG: metal-dependent transcriptional regulator [Candidatus Thermoplasmatota archaeon]|nr:metal-dependent transcriptional regulator [Euryarchaeota archaeon]MBU4032586.1 metal-dependent transcriptional regulator [Candidatus Thermoplasmatota archaeon]MBU4070949.1 metal-dependent transcriptional regulator [Candidatus Thermoplasmatota archaeon]MBU4144153.1 metal-dependent transcriptional regulator [Candidatus Thermoplasmatota archaeon]MBU4591751.1 metal-dependent transcriptional regulator [Candidatus Thermoplasmatota archaeon]